MRIACFADTYLPSINGVTMSVEQAREKLGRKNELMVYVPGYEGFPDREKKGKTTVERSLSVPAPAYNDVRIALPNWSKLVRSAEEFHPDILHVHTPGTLGIAGVLLARRLKKPLVGTYHTLFSEELVYFSPKRLLGWAAMLEKKGEGTGFLNDFIEGLQPIIKFDRKREKNSEKDNIFKEATWFAVNKFYNYCDELIVPSQAIKDELLKRGMRKPMTVISNGIDTKLFPRKAKYKFQNKILHVGRLGYEKNVEVVVRAFGYVAKRYPKASMTIAGDGPATGGLKKLVEKLGLGEKIEFSGWVDRSDLGRIYRSHDVFVTASTMETQGLVILEAMLSGLPVVGVDKYAIPDVVEDGKNGFVTKPFDDEAMGKAICKIFKSNQLEEEMGKSARKTGEAHNVKETIKKLEFMYKGLIDSPKSG